MVGFLEEVSFREDTFFLKNHSRVILYTIKNNCVALLMLVFVTIADYFPPAFQPDWTLNSNSCLTKIAYYTSLEL